MVKQEMPPPLPGRADPALSSRLVTDSASGRLVRAEQHAGLQRQNAPGCHPLPTPQALRFHPGVQGPPSAGQQQVLLKNSQDTDLHW